METFNDVLTFSNELIDAVEILAALNVSLEYGLFEALCETKDVSALSGITGLAPSLVEALLEVGVATGTVLREEDAFIGSPGMRACVAAGQLEWLLAKIRSAQLQSWHLVRSAARHELSTGWNHTDLDVLRAQGRQGSWEMVEMFAGRILPALGDLGDRLAHGTASFLDVGTGVGALSIAMAQRWRSLHVVGIEPSPVPLAEARANVLAAGQQERIQLRAQRVEELVDEDAFDLVWLPQMFLTSEALLLGVNALWRALRPGGWVWIPVLKARRRRRRFALGSLRNVLWGGEARQSGELTRLLMDAGFSSVKEIENKPGEYMFVAACKAA